MKHLLIEFAQSQDETWTIKNDPWNNDIKQFESELGLKDINGRIVSNDEKHIYQVYEIVDESKCQNLVERFPRYIKSVKVKDFTPPITDQRFLFIDEKDSNA